MRIRVDPDKCQGHNRCYALAPEVFDVDELRLRRRDDRRASCPPELEDKAALAAANCPEYAITIEE